MRVISGTVGGYKLKTPDDDQIRPTSDRAREALFNVLTPWISGACFLDLFCGTGANGIEALSRGAKTAVFVDKSTDACTITRENLLHTGLDDRARVIYSDYIPALSGFDSEGIQFDIIFMDPPYDGELATTALEAIMRYKLLIPSGFIIVESMSNSETIACPFPVYRDKRYGLARLTIFRNE